MPVCGYILVHITYVELMEPTFWLRDLELNEYTNNRVTYTRKCYEGKEQETMKEHSKEKVLSSVRNQGRDTALSNEYNTEICS